MRDRIAEVDWSQTPIGDPDGWSESLRTAVRVVLTSRFSMWMAWGPELTVFYNDAYARDTLAEKHPWAFGRPAGEVWGEIWAEVHPRIEHVLTTGEATWDEALMLFLERSGYREETYHTFSYSPLVDDDGTTAGMLCVVSEDTDRMLAERRMDTLRELGQELTVADSEPALWTALGDCLERHARDLPFVLAFVDGEGDTARLAAHAGVPEDDPLVARAAAALGAPDLRLVDLVGIAGVPTGPWDDPPAQAAAIPFGESAGGFLVAGLNPYRAFDEAAQSFLVLVAGQVGASLNSVRARQADRERAEALAELDRAKTEFFSNVSHEFRTPLTLIAGPADDAAADAEHPLPGPQLERVEIIRRNARRLRRLIDTMLDFSRIEGGRLEPDLVAVDLGAVTRGIAESFAPAVTRAGLAFEVDCPDLSEPALVDLEMWEKVVLNLLSNALKFTLEGSIRIALREVDAELVTTVSDTGAGITEEQLPHLFDRFHRARPPQARSHEGTGIGLALVRELVTLHGGVIGAASDGHGSAFEVRLPRRSGVAPVTRPQAGSETASAFVEEALQWGEGVADVVPGAPVSTMGDVAGATVLVAEDNADLRRFLAGLLGRHFTVHVADDGAEALEIARRERPDLVLSDVMMPGVDGFELLAAIRADPALIGVPVILLSARAGQQAAIEGLEAGADDYLVKPFSSQELLARVRSNLELSRLRSQEAAWRATLLRAMQDGFAIADPDGTIVEMNEAFAEMVGFGADGVPYAFPHPWWPDREREPDEYREVVQCVTGATGPDGGGRWVLPLRHAGGRRLWVSVSIATVRGRDGRNEARVCTAHDVTREHRATLRSRAIEALSEQLTGAEDVGAVAEVALSELGRLWPSAHRLVAVTWNEEGVPATLGADARWDDLTDAMRATLQSTRQAALPQLGAGLVAAPVAFGDDVCVIGMEVGGVFDEHDVRLLDELAQRLGQPLTRARLFEEQRSTSITLQRAMLGPSDLPEGFAVRYEPAGAGLEVGGDWYDAIGLAEGCVGVVVGDCVGRGVHAAAVMGQLRSACRALLMEAKDPGAVLGALDAVAELIPGARCTTVFCATIGTDSGTLTYSSAGHLPGILVHPDGTSELLDAAGRVPLASFDAEPLEAIASLRPGTLMVLYTDGLVERRDRDILDGIDALRATVVELAGAPAAEVADVLAARHVPVAHDDDVAYLVYRQPIRGEETR